MHAFVLVLLSAVLWLSLLLRDDGGLPDASQPPEPAAIERISQ